MRKVNVIMQNCKDDCGMCCIMMILRYYGCYIYQREIEQNQLFKDNYGISNMLDIKKCAEYYGLTARGFKADNIKVFDDLSEPAILFWNYNHFVVFEKKKNGVFYIINPDKGREFLPEDEFLSHFSGTAMTFERTNMFCEKKRNIKKEFVKIYKSDIWDFKLPRGYLFGLLASQFFLYLIPIFIRGFVSQNLEQGTIDIKYGIYILSTILLYIICSIYKSRTYVEYIKIMKSSSNKRIIDKVLGSSFTKLRKRLAGDILSRIVSNDSLCEIIALEIPKSCVALIFAVAAGVYLFTINAFFSGILIAICIIISCSNFILLNKTTEYTRIEVRNFAEQYSMLLEGISSLYFIKANNIAKRFINRWNGAYTGYLNSFEKRERVISYFSILESVSGLVAQMLFLLMSFVMALVYPNRIADASIFLTMATLIYTPITQISFSVVNILRKIPDFNRIIDLVSDYEKEYKKYSFSLEDKIAVENLSFSYPKTVNQVLDNISLYIQKGDTIAILGASGSGKTTFTNILLGIEKDYIGNVKYDGKEVRDIEMRDNICCITQDNILYSGTLAEYLMLFIDVYDDDRVMNGIEKLQLKPLFENCIANGMFRIEENGSNLSGGQKQRLALLRMFLRDYELLILDEPTSHLDEMTAQVVVDEICDNPATKIIITHDTRLLDRANHVYEIRKHKIYTIR